MDLKTFLTSCFPYFLLFLIRSIRVFEFKRGS